MNWMLLIVFMVSFSKNQVQAQEPKSENLEVGKALCGAVGKGGRSKCVEVAKVCLQDRRKIQTMPADLIGEVCAEVYKILKKKIAFALTKKRAFDNCVEDAAYLIEDDYKGKIGIQKECEYTYINLL
jgi:hypothetical protein